MQYINMQILISRNFHAQTLLFILYDIGPTIAATSKRKAPSQLKDEPKTKLLKMEKDTVSRYVHCCSPVAQLVFRRLESWLESQCLLFFGHCYGVFQI